MNHPRHGKGNIGRSKLMFRQYVASMIIEAQPPLPEEIRRMDQDGKERRKLMTDRFQPADDDNCHYHTMIDLCIALFFSVHLPCCGSCCVIRFPSWLMCKLTSIGFHSTLLKCTGLTADPRILYFLFYLCSTTFSALSNLKFVNMLKR